MTGWPCMTGISAQMLDTLLNNRPLSALRSARRIVQREASEDLRRLLPPGTVLMSQVSTFSRDLRHFSQTGALLMSQVKGM